MFRLVLALALFAAASAFVRTPMRVQRVLAPKMVPLEEIAFTVAKASEPITLSPTTRSSLRKIYTENKQLWGA